MQHERPTLKSQIETMRREVQGSFLSLWGNQGVSKRIEDIRLIVEVRYDCEAKHECSVPVIEMDGKDDMWEGVVETFALTGHPKARRCYAWILADDDAELRYITA